VELQEAFLQFGLGVEEVPQPPPQEAHVAASAAMGMNSPSWLMPFIGDPVSSPSLAPVRHLGHVGVVAVRWPKMT
jgi:hypothetical protein